jgi:transposase
MTLPPDLRSLDPPDKDALIVALLARVDELCARTARLETENAALRARVSELEAKLGLPPKTPNNSSTPPSQGHKAGGDATVKPKAKPHAGAHRPLHPNPTAKREFLASSCQRCGADVSQRPQMVCEAYDHVEIPDIKPNITRVTLHGGTCPCCGKRFKAPAPIDMPPGSPFGPNLRALVIYLRFTQNIAFERLARLLSDLLGLDISEGALINMLDASRDAFAAQTSAIRARLLSGTALESDETGLRVGKKNWWLWVFHHDNNPVFVARPTRAKTVVAEFLGDFRPDFWVSDRYGGQMGWAARANQVCLAHLIRDVQYVIDASDDVFAPKLRHLLGRACRIGQRRPKLADATLKTYTARLDACLDEIMALQPTHEAGVKLQRVIKKIRRHMFVFVTNRDIPATNNGSERALRPSAVFRKVTNGFRTEWGAKLYADIRSVVETGRRRTIRALEAIRLTLARKPLPTPV